MEIWLVILIAVLVLLLTIVVVSAVWIRRSGMSTSEATIFLRNLGTDLVRLPGTLRRLAADPRTPRRARWTLIALAIYVVSPIDIVPDFIPVIGHLDEVIIVPLVLAHVRRLIPDAVWTDYFPKRSLN